MNSELKDRLEINGVWYVREDKRETETEIELFEYDGIVYEDDKCCIDVTRLTGHKEDVSVNFTDKTKGDWEKQHWDNPTWMRLVAQGKKESLAEMSDLSVEIQKTVQKVFKKLTDLEWL